MRNIAAAVLMVGVMAAPAAAQWGQSRVPPGQIPPAGSCRVWYDRLPPGQQPPPTNCRDAERTASRSRDARVIYGSDARQRNDRNRGNGRWDDRYPDRSGRGRGGFGVNNVPFQNGYRDGYDKGREDARDRDSFDPVRHSRYRSADRGYERRYGSKDQYKLVYRDGFESGYQEGYRDARGGRDGRDGRGGWGIRWPR